MGGGNAKGYLGRPSHNDVLCRCHLVAGVQMDRLPESWAYGFVLRDGYFVSGYEEAVKYLDALPQKWCACISISYGTDGRKKKFPIRYTCQISILVGWDGNEVIDLQNGKHRYEWFGGGGRTTDEAVDKAFKGFVEFMSAYNG